VRDLFSHFEDIVRIFLDELPEAEFVEAPQLLERDDQYGRLTLGLRYPDASELHILLWADCSGDHPLPMVHGATAATQHSSARAARPIRGGRSVGAARGESNQRQSNQRQSNQHLSRGEA